MEAEQETRGRGRPTDYRQEYAEQAKKLAEHGLTDQELADFFEVDVRTIYRWKVAFPEFSQSLKLGKDEADDRVERSLYHRAVGYSHDSVKIFNSEGTPLIVPYREHFPPDNASAIFWLKNRRPDVWRDRQEQTTLTIELTYKRESESFGRVIEQAADAAPERVTVAALLERHPVEVREHLRVVLQDVPEDELEAVYAKAVETVLATSHRGQGEDVPRDLAEKQNIAPDVTELGAGYMANLDEPEEEAKQDLQDALAKVDAHNRKVRDRGKKK